MFWLLPFLDSFKNNEFLSYLLHKTLLYHGGLIKKYFCILFLTRVYSNTWTVFKIMANDKVNLKVLW